MLKQVILVACWSSSASKRALYFLCISGGAYLCRFATTNLPGIASPGTMVSLSVAATFIPILFYTSLTPSMCKDLCIRVSRVCFRGILVWIFRAPRSSWLLRRYPVEQEVVASGEASYSAERRLDYTNGFSISTAISGEIFRLPSSIPLPTSIYA